MIRIYTQLQKAEQWLEQYRKRQPHFACVLGFTETGLIPNISAAGATPIDRQYTAIADAEFLYRGPQRDPCYPLPPLHVGVSPALISRAVIAAQALPLYLLNAGLPHLPAVPVIDLGGTPAQCLSQGSALSLETVHHLLQQGLIWGTKLAAALPSSYLILSECVVGGTTTALAILTGLGYAAAGKVNSSHPTCNHAQKWALVEQGLRAFRKSMQDQTKSSRSPLTSDPLQLVAAVGDPMQVVVAGMAIAASRSCGVLLAGGTQMLAVYALAEAIANVHELPWRPEQVVVGTTRWVAEDLTADTVGLAELIGTVPLLATQLSFAQASYPQLQAYEQGFVKEGLGAGGCAIAAHLYHNWDQDQLLQAIEALVAQHAQMSLKDN